MPWIGGGGVISLLDSRVDIVEYGLFQWAGGNGESGRGCQLNSARLGRGQIYYCVPIV